MPISREQKLQYMKTFRRIMKTAETIPDDTARELLLLLQGYRKEVIAYLADASGWNAYYLPQIQRAIDDITGSLQRQLTTQIRVSIDKAWESGTNLVSKPFAEIGITTPTIGMSLETLTLAKELSADLVTDLSAVGRQGIMRQVRMAIMGNKSQMDVIKAIGRLILSDTARQGQPQSTFKTLAGRAEAISRTETMRVLNAGHHAKATATAEQVPDLRKYWMATWDSRARAHHLQADQSTNYYHGGKPIPFKASFVVGGHKCYGPHDPSLPPEECVNCRCKEESTLLSDDDIKELYPSTVIPFKISELPAMKKALKL